MNTQDMHLSKECFQEFVKLTHELTGISVSQNRLSMIEGRLRKRINQLNLVTYERYLLYIKENRSEHQEFVNLITTNETYFFRTPRIWEYVEKTFIPEWYSKNKDRVLNIWSAASSSGEEAYSLGVLCQSFKEKNIGFKYKITGTDISEEMTSLCKQAQYQGRSIQNFINTRPELFEKFMKKNPDGNFSPTKEIRTATDFKTHNLFHRFSNKSEFDLVLIRNVLIYFKANDQEKVLAQVAAHCTPESTLIIGESESLTHIKTAFTYKSPLIYSVKTIEEKMVG